MKDKCFVLIGFICACVSAYAQPATTLLYKNSFDTPASLADWKMEGPGVAKVEGGRLLIHSKWADDLERLDGQIDLLKDGGGKYYPFIEQWVKEREPESLPKYVLDFHKPGQFSGGHIQFWNKHAHPENFLIRLKFQAANPYPLHMVTFCGRGVNGEDVLDPKLAPRFGLAAQYMYGDIQNYRISYWAGSRGTSNMRRAPGRQLTAEEKGDVPRIALKREVQLEIFRWNGHVVFRCDGEKLVDWIDDEPFGDGFFALRLMASAKGWYDDYEVYELNEDPFAYAGKGENITSRLSAQRDVPQPKDVIDGKFIVVGNPEPEGKLYRDVINTYKGNPVYRFEASPKVNRVELTTCYASNLEGFSERELSDLSELANLYLKNDQGHYGDTITYEWNARFPEPLKEDAKGIFAQWHGRPDRTLVITPEGERKILPTAEYIALRKSMKVTDEHIGIDPKTDKPNGWKFDGSAGGPIAAFKFQDGHMCLLVRNDPNARSDNTVRIKPKPVVRREQAKGNKTGACIFEKPIAEVPIDKWINFKVQIKYSKYSLDHDVPLESGFVKVWMDGEPVVDWTGDIGKNDEKGPYFKYGIYKPGADGFMVDCAGFTQTFE
ncbi:DUF1961 family protein [Pontiella sulfatireligans]|uniref:Heparin lyase I n=1 Tax=Pontiella sulfatireligans TaxID=2750658 RepID=A0A6C2UTU5_9BACT|nr:DUF1961 family protein [Pontiella sulfatireligans]VGO22326.1 Heparin lyase I [Pontiella sulfatireligans]